MVPLNSFSESSDSSDSFSDSSSQGVQESSSVPAFSSLSSLSIPSTQNKEGLLDRQLLPSTSPKAQAPSNGNGFLISQTTVDIPSPPVGEDDRFSLPLRPSSYRRASSTPPNFRGQIISPFQSRIFAPGEGPSPFSETRDLHTHSDSASGHHEKCLRRWVRQRTPPSPSAAPLVPPSIGGEGTESDSSFAPLLHRLRHARNNVPLASQHSGSSLAVQSRKLATSSSIRLFKDHSQLVPAVEGVETSSSAEDNTIPRLTWRYLNPRKTVPSLPVRFRLPGNRPKRPMPSLPSRLETLTAYYFRKGYSQLAFQIYKNGNTDSTHCSYKSVWALFKEFLSYKRIHISRIRKADILNFLSYHCRVNNRKYRTLAKYRAAIKMPIKKQSNINLDSDFSYQFMRGLRREVPPIRSAHMPN